MWRALCRTQGFPELGLVHASAMALAEAGGGRPLHTLAQLHTAKEGVLRLKDALAHELHIPPLVRDIWGAQCERLLAQLRQQRRLARGLVRRWEDAEHRLIAVANSLATVKAGQAVVAVGAPLAASQLLRGGAAPAQCYHAVQPVRAASAEVATLGQLWDAARRVAEAAAREVAIALRGAFLALLFLPVLLSAPLALLSDGHRAAWLRLVRGTLKRAGPAFIKWGQWAATRPDLFPLDVCEQLAALQTQAPAHAFLHTRGAVEAAFGCTLERLFDEFDPAPVASGSIAQVHRAVLSAEGARRAQHGGAAPLGGLLPLPRRRVPAAVFAPGARVAVKVRHPGVDVVLEQDVALMQRAVALAALVPGLGGQQVKESVMQFGAPLREQLDLTAEAAALSRFAANFRWWRGVRFPLPAAPPMVAPGVLVESFEEGEHISDYMAAAPGGGRHSKMLAGLGLGCYLKMLLKDNFLHADMHPGNILVRLEAPGGLGSWASALCSLLRLDLRAPRLVLLDVGMTARLSGDDQCRLRSFFGSLTSLDGGAVADAIMRFSEKALPDPAAFRADMKQIFSGLDPEHLRTHTQEVIGDMMDAVRRHGVHLQGIVTTVIVTSMVLEGWSTKLDPDIRILETVKALLPEARAARLGADIDAAMRRHSLAMA